MADTHKTMQLLWPDSSRAKRGPKPRMTLEGIVAKAIAIADAEGLDSVSMQRVADELGATKMSLYRYTPGKTELTAVMLDTAIGGPPALSNDGWRAAMTGWAFALHHAMSSHPWSLELAVGARVLGPNELGWAEVGLQAMSETALSRAQRLDALALITGHVRGMVAQSTGSSAAESLPERGVDSIMAGVIAAHADRYPEVAAAFADARANSAQDNALTFGLERILDGLEVAMTRQA